MESSVNFLLAIIDQFSKKYCCFFPRKVGHKGGGGSGGSINFINVLNTQNKLELFFEYFPKADFLSVRSLCTVCPMGRRPHGRGDALKLEEILEED